MSFEFLQAGGTVKGGKLEVDDQASFRRAMSRFGDGPVTVRIERARERRSAAQNRYWHGVVVDAFAEHCGNDHDDMHEILKMEINSKVVEFTDPATGEVKEMRVGMSTANLTTKAFAELIERAQRLGATMGIYIPNPGEVVAA